MNGTCGAKTRNGGRCRRAPAAGRTRCRLHGGASLSGPDHPGWKSGAYSRAFGPLQKAVEAAIEDPDIFDTRRGVAAWAAAIEEAGQRLEEHDTPDFRKRAISLARKLGEAVGQDAPEFTALMEWLEAGVSHDKAFKDVIDRAERHRIAVNDALKVELQASSALGMSELGAALDGLVRVIAEKYGADDAREIVHAFDRTYLKGKLAQSGLVLGARAVDAEGVE